MGRFKIAILICSYNEEKTIRNVVLEASKIGKVFLIDDCSQDMTKEKISDLNIYYYKNNRNIGYERSLERGFKIVLKKNYDFLITMDADGQHEIKSVKKIISRIKNFDILIGSRKKKNNLLEKILSFFSNKYLGIDDILCGLKAYRLRKFLKDKNKLKNIIGTKYLFYGIINNLSISQVEISCNKREVGKSRYYSNIFNYIKIFKLIFIIKNLKKNA